MKRRSLLASLAAMTVPGRLQAAAAPLLAGVDLRLSIDDGLQTSLGDLVSQWIAKSAEAVTVYYGRFPVPILALNVSGTDGDSVGGGHSEPGDVPVIEVNVGTSCSADELLHWDWVLVHEMIHMAIPYVPHKEFWAAEGLAVYVESIARIQAGHIDAAPAFGDFIRQMPKGLPKAGEGLSASRDHGRVYWGGALFFLEADVRIRQATGNRLGLQTALRAINASGDFRQEKSVSEFFPIGDRATGTDVLMKLYDEMAMKGGAPDMAKLWAELGVIADGRNAKFEDAAPLADIRKAILRKVT
jgi:hypothetical protein